jgi:ribonuclease HII
MYNYEEDLWDKGLKYIAGIDEVGRGCLFGDVVAAAVILDIDRPIVGLKDSKQLSATKREQLYIEIMENSIAVAIGRVDAHTIDRINIKRATIQAMEQAVFNLKVMPEVLLIDAERIISPIKQVSIVKGDQLSASIAAASIIAKVTRDRLCLTWGEEYPLYRIEKHKGYGTREHIEQLQRYGKTPLHRETFLKNILLKD